MKHQYQNKLQQYYLTYPCKQLETDRMAKIHVSSMSKPKKIGAGQYVVVDQTQIGQDGKGDQFLDDDGHFVKVCDN